MAVIDLHTHILPGLDDGAKSWGEAVEMARAALDDGISTIVATPHMFPDGAFANRAKDVLPKVAEARARWADLGISVELVAGAEIYIAPDIRQGIERGELLTYGDQKKYTLIEFPGSEVPPYADDVFFQLQLVGVTPILAHPERNPSVTRDLRILADWIERGVIMQVNGRSLLGESGARVQRVAEELLARRMVHLLASDAHGATRRPPELSKARERAAAIAGRDLAEELVLHNPRRVLRGENVRVWEVLPEPRRGILSRLLRRH